MRKEKGPKSAVADCWAAVAVEQADCRVDLGLALSRSRVAIAELQNREQVGNLEVRRPKMTEDTAGLAVAVLVHMKAVADIVVDSSAVQGTVDRADGQPC